MECGDGTNPGEAREGGTGPERIIARSKRGRYPAAKKRADALL